MAKAAKTAVAEKPKTGGAITAWDAELAKYAAEVSKQEDGTLFGNMFSLKGGILAFQNQPIPGNEMDIVILDHIHARAYYKDKYDSENPSGPSCFSLSKDGKDMAPSDKSAEKQSPNCASCAFNQMGSADTGRGKACREGRRVAVISKGVLNEGETAIKSATIAYLTTPPTSIVPFATYIKNLAEIAKRPPFSVITKVKLVPDKDTQFKLQFEHVSNLGQDVVKALLERRVSAEQGIFFDYQAPRAADEKPKPRVGSSKPQNPQAKANGKAPAKHAPPPATKTTKSGARVGKF